MSSSTLLARSSPSYLLPLIIISLSIAGAISILLLTRLLTVLLRPKVTALSPPRPPASSKCPTHVLIVLGSGGHTAEMLNMLRRLPLLPEKFTHRTYVVSSGDGFSALKAREFEWDISGHQHKQVAENSGEADEGYDVVTVRRARRVHQSLLSTPWSAFLCLQDCIELLMGRHQDQIRRPQSFHVKGRPSYPDLILTNGPGTGVCVVLASLFLRFFGFSGPSTSSSDSKAKTAPSQKLQWQHSGHMRTIFVESWARVTTLSLSGKILLPLVDRFLVQWPTLEGRGGGKAEFVGTLVA
jgi:beta-1,4-N-acetylglucosaminyltransferase